MIILYANAGKGVGFGHIFRLLPVFDYLQKSRISVRMFTPLPKKKLNNLDINNVESIEPGIEPINTLLKSETPEVFCFDSYEQPNRLIKKTSLKNCKVVCFDDHYKIEKSVHTIINPAIDAKPEQYKSVSQCVLSGPDYFPLIDDFKLARQKMNISKKIQRVIVSMGGDDTEASLDMVLKVLLMEIPDKIIVDVYGNTMPEIVHPALNKLGWCSQVDLVQKLSKYDIAVLAGGSMLQQCACIGLPVISWPQHERQEHHAETWEKIGSVISVNTVPKLKAALKKINNPDKRKRMYQAGRKVIDRIGAERIVTHFQIIYSRGGK